jgi:hypothetical protein
MEHWARAMIYSSVERFFRRLIEENPFNEDAKQMLKLTLSLNDLLESDTERVRRLSKASLQGIAE